MEQLQYGSPVIFLPEKGTTIYQKEHIIFFVAYMSYTIVGDI